MYENIEHQNSDSKYWRLVAGGWVPMSELVKNYQHPESSLPIEVISQEVKGHHFPNM